MSEWCESFVRISARKCHDDVKTISLLAQARYLQAGVQYRRHGRSLGCEMQQIEKAGRRIAYFAGLAVRPAIISCISSGVTA